MNKTSKIQNKIINVNDTIISALRKMDGHRTKLVFVFDGDKFESILTIGDIQRAIIRHSTLTDPVSTILDRDKIYASDKDSMEHIKEAMMKETSLMSSFGKTYLQINWIAISQGLNSLLLSWQAARVLA